MNSIAGLRMEERSPGSYRLSIRGSLLRSPFGIRDIKIYFGEFPLTDAGGNTYLNSIDEYSVNTIQVLKGPEGSMFGANTGGVVILGPGVKTGPSIIDGSIGAGSFGLFNEHIGIDKKGGYYSLNISQSFQKSDGYRQNSALNRNYLQAIQNWNFKNGTVKLLFIGSQLHYETPGGLTMQQFDANPGQARPPVSIKPGDTIPGAMEQKAGVYNSTIYAGVSEEIHLNTMLKHVFAIFGSYTDYKNPFITNYEKQTEWTSGIRTYIDLGEKLLLLKWNWDIGIELQQSRSTIANYGNSFGIIDTIQVSDDLNALQSFVFSQFSMLISTRLEFEAAVSFNFYQYNFKNLFPNYESSFTTKKLSPEVLPRIGISYRIVDNLVWRGSISKGYSPPSFGEIRPSDKKIYTGLKSEFGWNFETGFRFKSTDHRWDLDFVLFKFDLMDAIVSRTDIAGAQYFVNAGGTNQMGLEFQCFREIVKNRLEGLVRGLEFRNGFTYDKFKFTNYSVGSNSYSGNVLTGVPDIVEVSSLKLFLPKGFNFFLSYNYTTKTPLNDNNTVYASSYHLIGSKLSWEYRHKNNYTFNLFGSIDNILNVKYSLGNDINAAGSRFFNPAPIRNYYCGMQIRF
jgi:iron complex outermembrane receptor protein